MVGEVYDKTILLVWKNVFCYCVFNAQFISSYFDKACTAHGPPSESAYYFNLGTRGKEEQEGERQKMGFATWTEAVTAARNRVEWRKQVNGPILQEES